MKAVKIFNLKLNVRMDKVRSENDVKRMIERYQNDLKRLVDNYRENEDENLDIPYMNQIRFTEGIIRGLEISLGYKKKLLLKKRN